MRATGTAGPVGASFAVLQKNWTCSSCKAGSQRGGRCSRCRAKRPAASGQDWHAGALALASGQDHGWREAMDPETKQIYYFNQGTKETSWDRPAAMGASTTATGWYGRGAAGHESKLEEKNAAYLARPAKKQIDTAGKDTAYLQGADAFNVWYGKYVGEHWSQNNKNSEPAKYRCNVELQAGQTRADKRKGNDTFFCSLFVKGMCPKGAKCSYYHRPPTYADCGRLEKDVMHDVFGRDRHAEHRDDMQGTGSYNSSSRTLYVGRLQRTPYAKKQGALKDVVTKHFEEWGEVEHINVIWPKSIAFVRFRFRSHAEFAKEAMMQQALDHDEILDIRWAHEDPNVVAKEAIKRANADAVVAAIAAAGHNVNDAAQAKAAFAQPAGYQPPAIEAGATPGQAQLADRPAEADAAGDLHYPDTSAQYEQPAKRAKTTASDADAASS